MSKSCVTPRRFSRRFRAGGNRTLRRSVCVTGRLYMPRVYHKSGRGRLTNLCPVKKSKKWESLIQCLRSRFAATPAVFGAEGPIKHEHGPCRPLSGESGHDFLRRECLLMTLFGHKVRFLLATVSVDCHYNRTRRSGIFHPTTSSQLAEVPDHVRSFGGDNTDWVADRPQRGTRIYVGFLFWLARHLNDSTD
jgi:hypothetical protein